MNPVSQISMWAPNRLHADRNDSFTYYQEMEWYDTRRSILKTVYSEHESTWCLTEGPVVLMVGKQGKSSALRLFLLYSAVIQFTVDLRCFSINISCLGTCRCFCYVMVNIWPLALLWYLNMFFVFVLLPVRAGWYIDFLEWDQISCYIWNHYVVICLKFVFSCF